MVVTKAQEAKSGRLLLALGVLLAASANAEQPAGEAPSTGSMKANGR
jgi:hypothetical protein